MEHNAQARLFVAVDMPAEVAREVTKIQNHLRPLNLFQGTYVNPDHVHVTLKFIGNIPEDQVDEVRARLRAVKVPPLKAMLGTIAFLPTPEHVRVITIEVMSEQLAALARTMEDALVGICEKEDRAFAAHLTIARVKFIASDARETLKATLAQVRLDNLAFTVDAFALKRSRLSSEGPEHYTLERYKLTV